MNSISYLKKDHTRILRDMREFEEVIDNFIDNSVNYHKLNGSFNKIRESLLTQRDYSRLSHSFHKLIDSLLTHNENEKPFLMEIFNNPRINGNIPKNISLDPRRIMGHIKIVDDAISSKILDKIKIAIDNDGRMLISRVKEYIFREEMVLDRLLFLHINNSKMILVD